MGNEERGQIKEKEIPVLEAKDYNANNGFTRRVELWAFCFIFLVKCFCNELLCSANFYKIL